MDVRCEQCGTVYEFESDRIRPSGVAVKCTTCGHIFKVFPASGPAKPPSTSPSAPEPSAAHASPAAPAPSPPSPGGAPPDSGAAPAAPSPEKRWLIRKPSGEVFRFKELTTLQQWIVEQKVSREDEISRTGRVWERLGAIKELEPFFAVVEKAREAERARSRPPSPAPAPTPAPRPDAAFPPSSPQGVASLAIADTVLPGDAHADLQDSPALAAGAPDEAIGAEPRSMPYSMGGGADLGDPAEPGSEPASLEVDPDAVTAEPAWRDQVASGRDDPTALTRLEEDDLAALRGGASRKLMLAAVAGILVALGGFVVYLNWARITALFSTTRTPTRGAYYKARTLLRMDTSASYQAAIVQLDRLLAQSKLPKKERARFLATKARVYATWAQSLRDEAADLLAPPGTVGGPLGSPPEPRPRSRPQPPRGAALDTAPRSVRRRGHKPPRRDTRAARAHSGPRGLRGHPRRAARPAARGRRARSRRPAGTRRAPPRRRPSPTSIRAALTAVSPASRTRAVALRREAETKAKTALDLATQAASLADTALTRAAMAEASRVALADPDKVSALVKRALAADPESPTATYTAAMLALRQGKLARAQHGLTRAVDLARTRWGKPYFRAIVDLARVYALRGQVQSAVTALQGLLSKHATHEQARALLQRLRPAHTARRGASPSPRRDASVPAAPPDASTRPGQAGSPMAVETAETEDYDALVRRAERFSFAGNQSRALTLYQRALQKRPSGVEALTGLGYAYLDRGNTASSISYFRKALAVSAGYGEAIIGLAEAYNRSGSPKQALRYYERYLQVHPAGRRSVLARQNVQELKEKLGAGAPRPATPRDSAMGQPPPAAGSRPVPGPPDARAPARPRPRVVEPPPAMPASPRRPATEPSSSARPSPMRAAAPTPARRVSPPRVREPPPARPVP